MLDVVMLKNQKKKDCWQAQMSLSQQLLQMPSICFWFAALF
jgi:hypothetical protein